MYTIDTEERDKKIIQEKSRKIQIISQDEIVPKKLKNYLKKHQEIKKALSEIEA